MNWTYASLAVWFATAGAGALMVLFWLAGGGARETGTGMRPLYVAGHLTLAFGGFAAWVFYVALDNDALAWASFATLAATALGGFVVLAQWLPARRSTDRTTGERRIPVPLVLLHGLLAVATLGLVLVVTLGLTESEEEEGASLAPITATLAVR